MLLILVILVSLVDVTLLMYILPPPGFVFTPSSTHIWRLRKRPTIMIFSFKLPAALLFFALSVSAAPAELNSLHVPKQVSDTPTFSKPDTTTTWCIGHAEDVDWYW